MTTRAPRILSELHPSFTNRPRPWQRDEAPQIQVYFQGAPELQEKELLELICTWLGARWPGNPRVIGGNVLYEESRANHGELARGAMAVRFATQELA